MGGEVGASIATLLNDSINVAGGLIAVALGFVFGLALMLKRAPTELLAGVANKIRPRSRRDEFELADGARIPFSLSSGDEVETDTDRRQRPAVAAQGQAARYSREARQGGRCEAASEGCIQTSAAIAPRFATRRARASGREPARAQCARARAETRGLRRRGTRGRGAAGPRRDDVQIRAGLRNQSQPDRQSC